MERKKGWKGRVPSCLNYVLEKNSSCNLHVCGVTLSLYANRARSKIICLLTVGIDPVNELRRYLGSSMIF